MKRITLLAAALLMTAGHANAAYTIVVQPVGSNVVATGSGSLNLTGLVLAASGGVPSQVGPLQGIMLIGSTPVLDGYDGIAGPASLGGGLATLANSATGPEAGMAAQVNRLIVPTGYVSGAALAPASSTWTGATLASLGLNPGTYTYTWAGDSLTIRVLAANAATVPTLSEWMLLILAAGLGLMARVRMNRAA